MELDHLRYEHKIVDVCCNMNLKLTFKQNLCSSIVFFVVMSIDPLFRQMFLSNNSLLFFFVYNLAINLLKICYTRK